MSSGEQQPSSYALTQPDSVAAAMDWVRQQSSVLQKTIINQAAHGNNGTPLTSPEILALIEMHQQVVSPIGNDVMVATPTGLGMQRELDELALAQQNGRSTHTAEDIERMTFAIEATVKQMIAGGASDTDIQQAVGQLPGVTPELSQLAQQVAQQQLDAEKFNLFNTRNEQAAEQASPTPLSLAAVFTTPMMELAAPKEQAPEQATLSTNPFAAALAGTNIAQQFAAALKDMSPSEPRSNTGQASQQRDTSWSRFS
jgi:hypothetical protein